MCGHRQEDHVVWGCVHPGSGCGCAGWASEDVVGFDLETHDVEELFTKPVGGFVRLVGVGVSGQVQVSPESRSAARLGTAKRVVGHNLALFDLPALDRHHGIPVEVTVPKAHDLRFCAFQDDPPTKEQTKPGPNHKSYSLDALLQRYLDVNKNEDGKLLAKEFSPRCTKDKATGTHTVAYRNGPNEGVSWTTEEPVGIKALERFGWGNIPVDDPRYIEYCRSDVELALRLAEVLPMTPYVEREMRIAAVTTRATLEGFRVDLPALHGYREELRVQSESVKERLTEKYGFPRDGKAPQRANAGKAAFKNALIELGFTPPALKNMGTPLPFPGGMWPLNKDKSLSLDKKVLEKAMELAESIKHPALSVLKAIQEMNGIRTNADNILRYVVGDRVHPKFEPFQTSGRWSVTEPGLTVLAKDANSERRFMLPEEGHVLISIDLDQADARGVAAHSQDHALLDIVNDPTTDLHTQIAIMAFRVLTDLNRFYAKTLDFGWLYGRGAKGMAENTPGVTMEAATRVCTTMAGNFPRVVEWQNEVRERASAGLMLDNGFGRNIRITPGHEYTQAPAYMGQSTTREFIAEGLLDLVKRAPEMLPMLRVIVHDEVVLSVPEKDAQECAKIVQECMSREWAPSGASRPVKVTAGNGKMLEFHKGLGRNWAECYKAKG